MTQRNWPHEPLVRPELAGAVRPAARADPQARGAGEGGGQEDSAVMFLSPDELAAASGRRRPKAQLRWALDRGLVPNERMTDADGRPLVLRSMFNPATVPAVETGPRWEALRGA